MLSKTLLKIAKFCLDKKGWVAGIMICFSLQDPLNHSMQQHPKKKSVLPKLRETYFFWSIFVPRKVHRATRRRIPDTAWRGKVLFPPSRKLTYPTLKEKETHLQKCLRGPMWSFLQGSFLQVDPPPRANLPHLRCRYSLPQALQRWRKKGAVGQQTTGFLVFLHT